MADASIDIALRMVDQATAPFRNSMSQIERSSTAVERQLRSITNAARLMWAGIAGYGVAQGGHYLLQTADQYSLLQGRVRLVTDSAEELVQVQEALHASARETRSTYEPTVELYARMARSTKELNLSNESLLEITETVNKAIRVSGATSAESSAAIIQLGQAMASGELRGQELRSVLEQIPRVARAIADGMGVPYNQLLKLGEAGELTTEKVVKALQNQAGVIDREFKQMPATVGQALGVVHNSLGRMVSRTNEAGHVTSILAEEVLGVADSLDQWTDRNQDLIDQKVPEYIDSITSSVKGLIAVYSALPDGVVGAAGTGILWRMVGGSWRSAGLVGALVLLNEQLEKINLNIGSLYTFSEEEAAPFRNLWDIAAGRRDWHTGEWIPESEQTARRIAELQTQLEAATQTEKPWYLFSVFDDTRAAAENVERLKREIAGLQEVLAAQRASESFVGPPLPPDYERPAPHPEKIPTLTPRRTKTAHVMTVTDYERQAWREEREAARAAAREEKEFARMREASQEAWLASLSEERRAIEEIDERYEAYRDAVVADYTLSAEQVLATLDALDARQTEALEGLVAKTTIVQTLSETMAGRLEDGFTAAFRNVNRGWDGMRQAAVDTLQAISDELYRTLVAKPAAQGIANWISSVNWAGLFASGAGGSDAALNYTGSVGANVAHSGWRVGMEAAPAVRTVEPSLFAGAPRLHSGLAADEFPAILQKGETVLPRGTQPRGSVVVHQSIQVDARGAGPGMETKIQAAVEEGARRGYQMVLADVKRRGPIFKGTR